MLFKNKTLLLSLIALSAYHNLNADVTATIKAKALEKVAQESSLFKVNRDGDKIKSIEITSPGIIGNTINFLQNPLGKIDTSTIKQSARLAIASGVFVGTLWLSARNAPPASTRPIDRITRVIKAGFKLYDDNKNPVHFAGLAALFSYYGKDGLQSFKQFLSYAAVVKGPAWAAAFNANVLQDTKAKEAEKKK